jgi:hypothetical protein
MALLTNGDGAGGARVDFEHVDLVALDGVLDIHEADHPEFAGHGVGVFGGWSG